MAELTEVHRPAQATGKPRLVFIHGLDGDYRTTWMAKRKDEGTLWPRWIGEDTGCPVWLLGYDAAMSRWKSDAMAVWHQAGAVLDCLTTKSDLMEGPLVLVGHSLGGLVIKAAIQRGIEGDVERRQRIARNVRGVAFIGTPHFGSMLASIAAYSHLMRANPQVRDLAMDDAHLEQLNHSFLKIRRELDIRVRVFRETQPVRLPWWLGGRIFPGVMIVPPSSSQAHVPGEEGSPIEADHISICKPLNRNAAIHNLMLEFIKEVAAAPPQSQADLLSRICGDWWVRTVTPNHESALACTRIDKHRQTGGITLEGKSFSLLGGRVAEWHLEFAKLEHAASSNGVLLRYRFSGERPDKRELVLLHGEADVAFEEPRDPQQPIVRGTGTFSSVWRNPDATDEQHGTANRRDTRWVRAEDASSFQALWNSVNDEQRRGVVHTTLETLWPTGTSE
jgi:pimeloyl-ACP methyl ester carboxylesterase